MRATKIGNLFSRNAETAMPIEPQFLPCRLSDHFVTTNNDDFYIATE